MNEQAAITFVRSTGNSVEQARLQYVLDGSLPPPQIRVQLFAGQREDGGWSPFWAPDYSSLDATCFRLAQAEQLGISAADAAIQRALALLARRQRQDGSWEEAESAFSALAGRLADLLASSLAWLLSTLLLAGVLPDHPLLEEAAFRLEQQQEPDGRWSSEDGPAQDVHTTVEALRTLHLCRYG